MFSPPIRVLYECCGELDWLRPTPGASKDDGNSMVEMAKRIPFALISRISTHYYVGTSTNYGSADIAI